MHASRIDRPRKLLRGFEKVWLDPGERQTVTFELTPRDLATFDEATGSFAVEDVPHIVHVGTSSRDADLLQAEFKPPR